MKYYSNLDLNRNELLNARIQNLSAAPASPVSGQVYYNTTDRRLYAFNSTAWVDLTAASGGTLSGVTLTNVPVVKSPTTFALGTATANAFRVASSDDQSLFEVKTNGDTVIGGILTVKGTGTSSFAGDVTIGGSLRVDGTITGGTEVNLGTDLDIIGNLNVRGNTTLGDDAAVDTTIIKGVTRIIGKSNKATGSATVAAFQVESKDALPLFQVMENGDAKIAGVLTVTGGTGSGGTPGASLTGDTTVDNLLVNQNLTVKGNTLLGDNAAQDTTIIRGVTTVYSKATKAAGLATAPTFNIKDSAGVDLFQVMENGDTIIAGVLKVKGTGESEFAGNVKIGGNLTVEGNATVKGLFTGNDFRILGNFVVDGNTTLGDNAVVDTTIINGKTTVRTGVAKASGSATVNAFEVMSSNNLPLFEVRQNGDAIIGANLKVQQGAIVAANMSGSDLTLDGNLIVRGNTTLGDASSDIITIVGTASFDQNMDMSSKRITSLANPTSPQDAATKAYVDATASGLDAKESVRVATTTNLAALTGLLVVDGITLVAGDRVLVKDQTDAKQNGIYVASATAWARSADCDNIGNLNGTEVTAGLYTFVEEGTVNNASGWVLTTKGAITIGTSLLTFVQFSGAGQIIAGNGLTKTGNTLTVGGTANRIVVGSTTVDIAPNYVGQTSITTLGTITSGVWNGTAIAVANGGTGSTNAVGARSNLGATGKYAADVGNGALTTITVTHGLNSQDVVVSVREKATNQMVMCDIEHTDANNVKLYFGAAPAAGALRAVVVG